MKTPQSLLVFALFASISAGSADPVKEGGWASLFNGKNLDGWTQRNGTATYRIEEGAIVGTTKVGSPNSFLCTDKLYGDFELTFEVKVSNELNSGVQIRSTTKGAQKGGDDRVNGNAGQTQIA